MTESRSLPRDAIQVGAPHVRMTVRFKAIPSLLVGHREEDIRLLRTTGSSSGSQPCCRFQVRKTASPHVPHRNGRSTVRRSADTDDRFTASQHHRVGCKPISEGMARSAHP